VGDASAIEGLVEVVEPLGAETLVEVSLGAQSLTARLKGDLLPDVGSVLTLHVEPRSVFVFSPEDGARLRAM
jgi:ABC-type sugar transport system ATPase subunit